MGILPVAACGFSPLYSGAGTGESVAEQRAAEVFIDEIPERIGQIMHRSLSDRLIPLGEPEHPRYRLTVSISKISNSEQAVRRDNLATRYLMIMTAKYQLSSYPEGDRLLSGSFSQRSAYDVQRSPYATDMAEGKTKERLAEIIGGDIALRVAAFLKGYEDPRDQLAEGTEIPVEEERADVKEVPAEEAAEEPVAGGEEKTDSEKKEESVSSEKPENNSLSDERETVSEKTEQAEE